MARGASGDTLTVAELRRKARERTLTVLEEARTCAHLLETGKVKNQRELAKLMGVSQARVSQRIALLKLPAAVMQILGKSEDFTERHARELRRLSDPKMQAWVAKKVISHHLSVQETTAVVHSMLKEMGQDPGAAAEGTWVPGPNYRWRVHRGWLEVRVKGGGTQKSVETLSKLLENLRRNPAQPAPHKAFDDAEA